MAYIASMRRQLCLTAKARSWFSGETILKISGNFRKGESNLTKFQNLPPDVLKHMAEINVGNPDNIIAYTTDSLPVHLGKGDKPVERAAITDELLREVDSNHLLVQYIDTAPGAPSVKSK